MNVLVVHAHPDPESFGAAVRDAALRGLETAGHDVTLIDLAADGYWPCLTSDDYAGYDEIGQPDGPGHPDPEVQRHIDLVRAAEMVVFTFPTFWSDVPAVLKGWIDRTLLPGVAFSVKANGSLRGELRRLNHVIGIATYGSPRWYRLIVGDAGRRTLRNVRRSAGIRCRFRWLALDRLDGRSDQDRADFLVRVETELAKA